LTRGRILVYPGLDAVGRTPSPLGWGSTGVSFGPAARDRA
jgi:hypothetical protein